MNVISGNEIILNKEHGIYISSKYFNIIRHNNFIMNSIHASFFYRWPYISNWWTGNYWDDWPLLIPRPIFGRLWVEWIGPWGSKVSWVNFDWCPAQKPYNIR
jgi:parallel beta-helix repeat protein